MITNTAYASLMESACQKQWHRIGVKRRSGVATPVFSIHSKDSLGIGEIPDLKLLVDWCKKTGMSIIQLLPMNDMGFHFCPYDSSSSFALDPMYLRLTELKSVRIKNHAGLLKDLRSRFVSIQHRVNYRIKGEKLAVLWKIYQKDFNRNDKSFKDFLKKNHYWVLDHALFRVIQEDHQERGWESWPQELRNRNPKALSAYETNNQDRVLFQQWLQWQLYEQMQSVKKYANKKEVYIMGDLPFLVSRSSADVWSHQDYFKLNMASGAPPDDFLAAGQRWGMPPYDWKHIAEHDYDYVEQKLKYAENFYDLFRLDHAIGVFRLWTIPAKEPLENAGINGAYDPKKESEWQAHGERILHAMIRATQMLPCAEDLGTIPSCSPGVFKALGIPGMDIQRWMRRYESSRAYIAPDDYRPTAIGSLATHDMSPFIAWWTSLPKDEKQCFLDYIGLTGKTSKNDAVVLRRAIEKLNETQCIFSILLLQDWMCLSGNSYAKEFSQPINQPGTFGDENWTWVMPMSLEDVLACSQNEGIAELNKASGRC